MSGSRTEAAIVPLLKMASDKYLIGPAHFPAKYRRRWSAAERSNRTSDRSSHTRIQTPPCCCARFTAHTQPQSKFKTNQPTNQPSTLVPDKKERYDTLRISLLCFPSFPFFLFCICDPLSFFRRLTFMHTPNRQISHISRTRIHMINPPPPLRTPFFFELAQNV